MAPWPRLLTVCRLAAARRLFDVDKRRQLTDFCSGSIGLHLDRLLVTCPFTGTPPESSILQRRATIWPFYFLGMDSNRAQRGIGARGLGERR